MKLTWNTNERCFDGAVYIVKLIFLIVFLTPISIRHSDLREEDTLKYEKQ